jgi:hypothetical protein
VASAASAASVASAASAASAWLDGDCCCGVNVSLYPHVEHEGCILNACAGAITGSSMLKLMVDC